MAEVAHARIVYEGDDRKFQAAARRVDSAIDRNVGKFRQVAAASARAAAASVRNFRNIALAATAAAGGLTLMAKRALAVGEDIADASNRTGAGIKVLQELRFAADQNGASAQALDDALLRLTRRMSMFAQDGTGPAAKAIQELGIQVTDADGKLRDSGQVFLEIAEKLETVENQAARAALASQLLGERSGPMLIPMLDLGRKGLEQYAQRARELGLVLDEAAVRKAGEANAKMRALGSQIGGVFNRAILDNVDSIRDMIDAFGDLIMAIDGPVIGAISTAIKAIGALAEGINGIVSGIAAVGEEALSVISKVTAAADEAAFGKGGLLGRGDYLFEQGALIGPQFGLMPGEPGFDGGFVLEPADRRSLGYGGPRTGYEAGRGSIYDRPTGRSYPYRPLRLEITPEDAGINEQIIKQEYAKYAKLRELADQYRADELDRERSFGSARLGIMQQAGQQQVATFGGFLDKMASTATGAYGQMFRSLALIAGKEGLINTYRAASQALADPRLPFWAKAAAVGQVIATGMNLVQSIQQVSGVSAGAGAAQPAPTVTAPPADGGGAGQYVNISVVGDVFGRDQVVALIERINEAVEDGAILRGVRAT